MQQSRIKSVSQLHQNDINQLVQDELIALRVHPIASHECCKQWQADLLSKGNLSRYSNATNVEVNRIGMTLFETENKPDKVDQYLKEGQRTLEAVESIFGSDNPLQLIWNSLSSSWPKGSEVQFYKQQSMNPGIIRSFESSETGGLPPHIDSLLKDLPDSNEFDELQAQLAANLYFELSEEGGELELWDFKPDPDSLETLYTGDYDFIDTNKIPVKPHILKPRLGELIIFLSSCVHSVKRSLNGRRSAASCFIGYYGENKPLTVWA